MNYGFLLLFLLVFMGATPTVAQPMSASFPKITGYVGVMHPVVTFGRDKPHYNFDGAYVGGLPCGINIWKSNSVGFSMEFVPFVRAANGTSKMNNLLFHPGALFKLGHGFVLATRAAFETSGRYGVTLVLNKTVIKRANSSYYVALPVPARFGNDQPASVSLAFQFGIAF
ncbi:hypothetical protein KTO58_15450 [Chitinophaga pendula]|uniref:hypothetical protein n=1 Tax=Chitinophaga TaxID=79328 RepID=UPI0018E02B13|nr:MULTISPECIES: hypothetical protein [Chitinophaga]UCJ05091.1 hypothetical protein KTO58_15450 [Chitinophaga pendula]